jgi:DNA polymerase III delta prime subunit
VYYDTEGSPANGHRWADNQRELDSLIRLALLEPEIADALRTLDIPVAEVVHALREQEGLRSRYRAARRWSVRLGLVEMDPGTWTTERVPGTGLVVCLLVVTGYLALMLTALPRMPLLAQVFGLLGLVAVVARAGRFARADLLLVLRAARVIRDPDLAPNALRDVVLPEVRQYIAEHSAPRYGTELSVSPAGADGGIAETATVVTSAGQRLRRLVQRSDADAIAIAGPRGVGKTTTIHAIADGMFSDADEPPPLSVVAAAPSRYDARDFVLHLHAALCRRVLGLLSDRLRVPFEKETRWRVRLRWFQPWLVAVGIVALLLLLALMFWNGSVPEFFAAVRDSSFTADRERPDDHESFPWARPLSLGLLVVVRVVAAVAIGGLLTQLLVVLAIVVTRGAGKVLWQLAGGHDPYLVALREEAYAQLRRTRFLQTHTSGWSGKIGLPSGSDLGVSRSVQRTEQTLTHPEVVDNFRRFAQRCADELVEAGLAGGLVIAIDELDKIANPEEAHEFVNDVKGVFGVRGCLFLVSVSEDAMAAFERRGIPVRDAFDSAFTYMVRLDDFTLAESRRWLSRRLLGVPEQFTYLLHCLSGGLPRDLLRAMDELVDIVREDDRGDLAHVAGALLDRELDRKAHAFVAAARRLDDSPELPGFLTDLLTMTDAAVDPVELAHRLRPAEQVSELHRVRWQSAGYLLFVATMREVFVNTLDKHGLAGVEQLAKARVHLAIDPQVAWRLVESVRASRHPGG